MRIAPEEATFARRGFRCGEIEARTRLEAIGGVFLLGYQAGLEEKPSGLACRLDDVESEMRGFAYEGAAMALALLGILIPWRWSHLQGFIRGAGDRHRYMVHVGIGWALGALPIPVGLVLHRLDLLLRSLAVDGVGFYHGYFAPRRHFIERRFPARLRGNALRAFDQGLGRALWFVEGADVTSIARSVSAFPEPRRADLWSGIGLACAYAGGVEVEAIQRVRAEAGPHRAALAQGACFAAKARQRAENPAPHTERACRVFCGISADAAAHFTDDALVDLFISDPRAYEVWRSRIQARFG